MRRQLPAHTEIVWRFHESAAEVILPDAIHHHSRNQRIVRTREPYGEFESSAAFGLRRKWPATECFDKAARRRSSGAVHLSANLHAGIMWRAFGHSVGHFARALGEQCVEFLFGLFDLSIQSGDLLANSRDLFALRRTRDHDRGIERRKSGVADDEIIRIERWTNSGPMTVAIDEGVIDCAIPPAREFSRKLRASGERRNTAGVGFFLQVEGQLHLIPLTDCQRAHDVTGIRASPEKLGSCKEELDRRRSTGTMPDVISPRTVTACVLARAPEVKADK